MGQIASGRSSWQRFARSIRRTTRGTASAGIPALVLVMLGLPLIAGCVPSSCGTHSFSSLAGVYAVAANDVWAVGSITARGNALAGLIEHWDGTRWVVVPGTATSGGADVQNGDPVLTAVAGSGADDVWAVGGSTGQSHGSVVVHWDGVAWHAGIAPCYTTCISSQLNAVAVLSATDAWAVGVAHVPGGSVPADHPLVEHWDGTQWQLVPGSDALSADATLSSLVVFSATDVWVFGAEQHYFAFIAHWDGRTWHVVVGASAADGQLPFVDYNTTLSAAAVDPQARTPPIWVVGTTFTNPCLDCAHPLILRGSASGWSALAADQIATGPAAPPPLAVSLKAVGVVGPADAWVVGTHQVQSEALPGRAFTVHWDGTHWQNIPAPEGQTDDELDAISVVSAADVWAVGSSTNLTTDNYWSHTLVEHWDGTAWTIVPSPNPGVPVQNACI